MNKKTKEVLETKEESFYSIYNAERRAIEAKDYNIFFTQSPNKVVTKIEMIAA
jgi:hypothetical protein